MTIDERRLLVRDRAERAAQLVRESWDEITALESIVPQDLPFDVHAYANMLAAESADCRIPEEAIDELLGLSAGDGSQPIHAGGLSQGRSESAECPSFSR
jgi:hypothetical protein